MYGDIYKEKNKFELIMKSINAVKFYIEYKNLLHLYCENKTADDITLLFHTQVS